MTGFSRSFFFNALYIVQFLSDKDTQKTGKDLYEFIQPHAKAAGLNVVFADVHSAAEFLEKLLEIVEHCRTTGSGPILHLETHGTPAGLGASEDQVVPWSAIVPALTELNRLSKMNLLVTMAACHGFNLIRTLHPGDESPAWGMFGPVDQVLPSDISNGFQAFFEALTREVNLNAAINTFQTAMVSWPDSWRFQNAELFLAYIYGYYIDHLTGTEELARREERIVVESGRRGIADSAELRALIRKAYRDEEGSFNRIKRRFLMLDRFPENEPRFPIDLAEINRLRKLLTSPNSA